MLRDITIGKYYAAKSAVHDLKPAVKIWIVLLYIASVFFCGSYFSYGVVAVTLLFAVKISKVPFGYIFRGMKEILICVFIIALLFVAFMPGEIVISFGVIKITSKGVFWGVSFIVKFITLFLVMGLLTYTTTDIKLYEGFKKILKPIKIVGIDIKRVSRVIVVVLKFVSIVVEEGNNVMTAQTSRGVNWSSNNVWVRIRNYKLIFLPVISGAVRRGKLLMLAMQVRD